MRSLKAVFICPGAGLIGIGSCHTNGCGHPMRRHGLLPVKHIKEAH